MINELLIIADRITRNKNIMKLLEISETKDPKEVSLNNKEKIGRNDPCPLGCGIKYKKCGIDDKCIKKSEAK